VLGRLQSLPRVSLGRALTLPRGTVELRRKSQTPPLGTLSTAQDSRLSRIYLMEPEPFARGADGSFLARRACGPLGLLTRTSADECECRAGCPHRPVRRVRRVLATR
jgi:hypothetical protein